jgi:hypothetical protein
LPEAETGDGEKSPAEPLTDSAGLRRGITSETSASDGEQGRWRKLFLVTATLAMDAVMVATGRDD